MLGEHLDDAGGESHLDDLAGQLVGNGVVVTFNLNVIVNVDLGEAPGGELVTLRGQGSKGWLVERFEERGA